MTRERLTEYGVTLLRVSLGVMYLAHSILLKLFTFGLADGGLFRVDRPARMAGLCDFCG